MAFLIEFQATEGQSNYVNNALLGKQLKVWREGLYQYTQLGGNYIFRAGNAILFVPALSLNERVRIQTLD